MSSSRQRTSNHPAAPPALLFARLRDHKSLVMLLTILCKEFSSKEVCLEFMKERRVQGAEEGEETQLSGLHATAVDGARCAFLDAFLNADEKHRLFAQFEMESEYLQLWLNPTQLVNALADPSPALGTYMLSMRVEHPGDMLKITRTHAQAHGVTKTYEHCIELLNPSSGDQAYVDFRNFDFTAGSLVDASLLFEVLTELKKSGAQSVELSIDGECMALRGWTQTQRDLFSVKIKQAAAVTSNPALQTRCECEGGHRESFISKQFLKLMRLCAKAGRDEIVEPILLQMGPDAPLSAIVQFKASASVQLFISPSLPDDDLL